MQRLMTLTFSASLCAATAVVGAQPASGQQSAPESVEAADRLSLPGTPVWLGSVRLPVRVLADGKPLPAGTYRVRLTGEHAATTAIGQLATLERWVEFVQGTETKGRALAPIVPAGAVKTIIKGPTPPRGAGRVQRIRDDDPYYRVWFNHRGDQVLVYLPIA